MQHGRRFNEDKEKLYEYVSSHRDELDRIDSVEMRAAFAMLGEQKRLKKLIVRQQKKGEEIGMCKAIDDLIVRAASDSALRRKLFKEYNL